MLRSAYILLVSLAFVACGKVDSSGDKDFEPTRSSVGDQSAGDSPEAFLFTATDLTYASSKLYRLDYSPKNPEAATLSEAMLSGSGDMIVTESRGHVFIFNRRAESLNFRELKTKRMGDELAWEFGPETATPGAAASDPHDVLVLDDERMVTANYVKGQLAEINYKTGKLITAMTLAKGVLGGEPFRPEGMIPLDDGRLAVLHQGYAQNYKLNGTQALMIFSPDEHGDWQQVNRPVMIPLTVNVPQGLFRQEDGSYLTFGLCAPGVECRAGAERIDIEAMTSEIVTNFDDEQMSYYGGPLRVGKNSFVMSVKYHGERKGKIELTEFDLAAKKQSVIHKYPDNPFSGYWGYDASIDRELVFYGDPAPSGGELTLYDRAKHKEVARIKTPLIPYSMLSVKPEDLAN